MDKRSKKRQSSDKKKKIVIAAIIILLVVTIDAVILIGSKRQQELSGGQKTSISSTEIGNYRRASDGKVQFSVNPRQVQAAVDKLGQSQPARGNQFVTVEIKVKNNSKEDQSLRLSNQILTTINGQRASANAELQTLIENGDWYKSIPAGKTTKGTLVFEINTNDDAEIIQLQSGTGVDSVRLRLN